MGPVLDQKKNTRTHKAGACAPDSPATAPPRTGETWVAPKANGIERAIRGALREAG